MNDVLAPSVWTIAEARSATARLRHLATTDAEYDGLELFAALAGYLDDLVGGRGFDRLLTGPERAALAGRIAAVRSTSGLSVPDADPRPRQPVTTTVTLSEGRRLAWELEKLDGWQAQLGRCLWGLYGYLDDLYGGPERFTDLLTPPERAQVSRSSPNR